MVWKVSKYTLKDLEMPDDEPMVIIRSSLLWICNGDKYAAAALNMYVHWTRWLMKRKPVAQEINAMLAKKGEKPSQDTTYIIYRKQQYLIDDLLGFCSDRRLRQANDLLQAKGLLKIEDTPRYLTDHVLKYELQIGMFKKLINEWRKHREENNETTEDEDVEVALEADSTGTDNYPSRSGKKSVQSSVRSGKKSVPERIIVGANNIDDKNIEIIDDKQREGTASVSSPETKTPTPIDNDFKLLGNEDLKRSGPKKEIVPELPLEQWPWDAKKALRIMETLVNTTYTSSDIELKACAKILDAYHPSQEIFIRVVLKILPWYKGHGLQLSPTKLAAKNTDGKVRFEDVLGDIKYVEQNSTPVYEYSQQPEEIVPGMTQKEAEQLLEDMLTIAQAYSYDLQGQIAQSKNGDTWIVQAYWDGHPVPVDSRSGWEDLFKDEQEYQKKHSSNKVKV